MRRMYGGRNVLARFLPLRRSLRSCTRNDDRRRRLRQTYRRYARRYFTALQGGTQMTIAELNEHKAKYEDLIKVRRLIGEQGAKLEKTTGYRKQVLVCGGYRLYFLPFQRNNRSSRNYSCKSRNQRRINRKKRVVSDFARSVR